jgi:hypothetical protein
MTRVSHTFHVTDNTSAMALLGELALPEITGSPKQVAWATDIRQNIVYWTIRVLASLDRTIDRLERRGRREIAAELAEARALLITTVDRLSDARSLIDFKGMLALSPVGAFVAMKVLASPDVSRLDLDIRWTPDRQAQLMTITLADAP